MIRNVKIKTFLNLLLGVLLSMGFYSCVGTVDDANPKTSKGGEVVNTPPSYSGLIEANAVSDQAVELYFADAPTADSFFQVYVNEAEVPIEISPDSVQRSRDTNYYLVTGLQSFTSYTFRVEVIDKKTNAISQSNNKVTAKTFANLTARFSGVSSVTPFPGNKGTTTVNIAWLPAESSGNFVTPEEWDVDSYEIRWSNNPSLLFTPLASKATVAGNVTQLEQVVFNGADRTYYVNVRAIHKGFLTFGGDPFYKVDSNTKTIAVELNSALNLPGSITNLNLTRAQGSDGLTKFTASWNHASGNHFGYSYCTAEQGVGVCTLPSGGSMGSFQDPPIFENSILLDRPGLTNKIVEFHLILCTLPGCATFEVYNPLETILLTPDLPSFGGIESFVLPYQQDADTFQIKVNPPDVAGHFTDYKLKIIDNFPNPNQAYTVGANIENPGDADWITIPKAQVTNGIITVDRGAPFTNAVEDITFQMRLTNGTTLTTIESRNGDVFLAPPTRLNFNGLSSCTPNGKDIDISWSKPTGGYWSAYKLEYEVIRNGAPVTNGFDAVAAALETHTLSNPAIQFGDIVNLYIIPQDSIGGDPLEWTANKTETISCKIDIPKLEFDQWEDVISLGGLEYRDDPGGGVNVVEFLDPNKITLEGTDPDVSAISGSSINVGTIPLTVTDGFTHIAFKDVLVKNTANRFITDCVAVFAAGADDCVYKIFRSEDNGAQWTDLGVEINNTMLTNLPVMTGTIDSQIKKEWDSNQIINFTDYTVTALGDSGNKERARLYLYKIVPTLKGAIPADDVVLPFEQPNIPEHHIVKVILPPANMGLVHRWIANKNACESLGKTIIKDQGMHYSCLFKGTGASAKGSAYTTADNLFVDIEGHLVVDRYELGCNFTPSGTNKFFKDTQFNTNTGGTLFGNPRDNTNLLGALVDVDPGPPAIPSIDEVSSRASFGGELGNPTNNVDKHFLSGDRYDVLYLNRAVGVSTKMQSILTEDVFDSTTGNVTTGMEFTPSNCLVNFKGRYKRRNDRAGVTHPAGGTVSVTLVDPPASVEDKVLNNWVDLSTLHRRWRDTQIVAIASGVDETIFGEFALDLDAFGFAPWVNSIFAKDIEAYEDIGTYPASDPVGPVGVESAKTALIYSNLTGNFLDPGPGSILGAGASNRMPFQPAGAMRAGFASTTPMGKVIASNKAGLPPLVGYSRDAALDLCQSYEIDLSLSDGAPALTSTRKRLMMRREAVAASHWPKHYEDKMDPLNNTIDEHDEVFPADNDCYGGTVINPGADNRFYNYDPNRMDCQSKYGLHAIVGGQEEVLMEALACDRTEEFFRINWGGGGSLDLLQPTQGVASESGHPDNVSAPIIPYLNSLGSPNGSLNPANGTLTIANGTTAGSCILDDFLVKNLAKLLPASTGGVQHFLRQLRFIIPGESVAGSFPEMRAGMFRGDGRFISTDPLDATSSFSPMTVADIYTPNLTTDPFNPIIGMKVRSGTVEDLNTKQAQDFPGAYVGGALQLVRSSSLTDLQFTSTIDGTNFRTSYNVFEDAPTGILQRSNALGNANPLGNVYQNWDYTMPSSLYNNGVGLLYGESTNDKGTLDPLDDDFADWTRVVNLGLLHGGHNTGVNTSGTTGRTLSPYSMRIRNDRMGDTVSGVRCVARFDID